MNKTTTSEPLMSPWQLVKASVVLTAVGTCELAKRHKTKLVAVAALAAGAAVGSLAAIYSKN